MLRIPLDWVAHSVLGGVPHSRAHGCPLQVHAGVGDGAEGASLEPERYLTCRVGLLSPFGFGSFSVVNQ